MHCPSLADLPPPPPGKTGWPWTAESPQLPDRTPDGLPWPRLSIVTPSYNQSAFLEETIRSVLLQGYPDLEYFVIDGGSKDDSVAILKKYEPWLTGWVSEKDRGQSHAINKGFERCTGDLITFQNSDDFYFPGAFDGVVRAYASDRNAGAVVGSFRFLNADGSLNPPVPPAVSCPTPCDLSLGPPITYRLHQVSTFFSRLVLDQVGRQVREDMHYTMDRELLFRVCRHSRILMVDQAVGAFRRHDESKSVSQILPFAQDFARLHLMHQNGNPVEDRRRHRTANHYISAGHAKSAVRCGSLLQAVSHLGKAIYYEPSIAVQRRFYRTCLDVCGLMPRRTLS